jgi:hypothetical protein
MKYLITIIFLSLVFLFACSDNPAKPENTLDARNFLPMSVGNYWIYEYTELDKDNKPIGNISIDSTVIETTTNYNGKTFYLFVTYRNNRPIDTSIWNADNLKIYLFANAENMQVPDMSDTVFKMFELYKGDWFIYSMQNHSMEIDFGGETHHVSGDFNFHGYRNYGDDTVFIHDKKYITMSTKFVSDRRYQLWDSTRAIYLHNQPCFNYFAENIGLIQIRKESHYIVEQGNQANKFWFNGWRRQMIRYSLKR